MNKKIHILLIFSLLFFLTAVFYVIPEDPYGNIWTSAFFLLSSLIASLSALWSFKFFGWRSFVGKALLFWSLGFFFLFLADTLWEIAEELFDFDVFPSFIDLVYLAAYPLIITGCAVLWKNNRAGLSGKAHSIFTALAAVLTVSLAYFSVSLAYDRANTWGENFFGTAYGFADVVILVGLTHVLLTAIDYKKGKFALPLFVVFSGMLLMLAGDILYSIYFDQYEEGGKLFVAMDLLWAASYYLLAYGSFLFGDAASAIKDKISKMPQD